jgi:competence protein ComEC
MPVYGVISVGKDNSYGHPHEAPMSRLEDAEVILYRTDKMGTIIAASNGTDISFTWENGGSIPATTYIGNKNSKKLHLPGCSSLPGEENRVTFEDYDKAISEGYTPCSKCLG